jgi:nitroreductase
VNVAEALHARRSVRAFLDRPVERSLLERLLADAARAPSGGNLQPWHVTFVSGESMARLKAMMAIRAGENPRGEPMEYTIYPPGLVAPYEVRRKAIGEAMYARLGIPREDREARRAWFAQNFQFFGAPAAMFCHVDRMMGPPQWSDLGMFLQSFMLLAVDAGLATCPQECWAMYSETMRQFLKLPDNRILFCGVAIGYPDEDAAVNRLESPRAALAEYAAFME